VAATICRALRYAPRWASWPDVTNRVAESWKGGPDDTINLLLRCSFLVLDDFGKEVAGDDDETRAQGWRREVAFRLINGRYERNLQTVIPTCRARGVDRPLKRTRPQIAVRWEVTLVVFNTSAELDLSSAMVRSMAPLGSAMTVASALSRHGSSCRKTGE
jgi:hypothetical protein